MPQSEEALLAQSLLEEAPQEWNRLKKFAEYHRGEQADPYTPKQVTPEFRAFKDRSKTNLLPNVVNALVDRLYVDGFRPDLLDETEEEGATNSLPWQWWQANGMDSRQNQVYEHAARYGYGYVMVWPGDPAPVLRPRSPRSWFARYDFPDDDFPTAAVRKSGDDVWLLTPMDMFQFRVSKRIGTNDLTAVSTMRHGIGDVPLVRFLNAWPDEDNPPLGEVEKLIDIQDRLNQTVFDLMVTQTYMGAPQQYVAGIVADADDKIKAIAKRVWTFDEPTTQVGQLPQADLTQLIKAIENAIRIYGIKAQTPPNYLLGEMVNISAEALVAAHADLDSKVENRQGMHAEAHENMFRLAGRVAGDVVSASDTQSQVVWRRTDPRSMASTVDALGKMVQMLQVPADEVWPMIPGVSQQDVARWRRKRLEGDPFVQLEQELSRQARSEF
jgi:hypothetical protein